MPSLDRVIHVLGEVEGSSYLYLPGAPWRLVDFDGPAQAPTGIAVGVHNPGAQFAITAGNNSPPEIVRRFYVLTLDIETVARTIRQLVGSTVQLGPRKADGTEYAADEQIRIGTVFNATNASARSAGESRTTGQRIWRYLLTIQGLPATGTFGNLWDEVTIVPSDSAAALTEFYAWCELIDIVASDELEITAARVRDVGQQYDARVRVRFDTRWTTERTVDFGNLRYSVVNVAEDTTLPRLRYQIIGLRRVE